jgi:hypothetical protein
MTDSNDTFLNVEIAAHDGDFGHNHRATPSDAMLNAGNYKVGRVRIYDMPIAIEQPRHSYRTGIDQKTGKRWATKLAAHYGYISGTRGADKDPIDCFIGYYPQSEYTFVINQYVDGIFDEHKIMLCFPDEHSVRKAYLDSFEKGWKGLHSIITATVSQLKWWLKNGNHTRPLAVAHLPYDGMEKMNNTKVTFDSTQQPKGMSYDKLLYEIRRADSDDKLLLDSVCMADILEDADEIMTFDALVTPYAKLERKMNILKTVMERSGNTIKPVAMQISDPFKQLGTAQVAVVFELSDGQTLSIFFHNPDINPKKIGPTDELISWKWLLNKKDCTIVVAPEHGEDLNIHNVATRVMKLAEKNSAAFQRANVNRAAKMQAIEDIKTEIVALEAELTTVQHELEVAKVEAEDRSVNPVAIFSIGDWVTRINDNKVAKIVKIDYDENNQVKYSIKYPDELPKNLTWTVAANEIIAAPKELIPNDVVIDQEDDEGTDVIRDTKLVRAQAVRRALLPLGYKPLTETTGMIKHDGDHTVSVKTVDASFMVTVLDKGIQTNDYTVTDDLTKTPEQIASEIDAQSVAPEQIAPTETEVIEPEPVIEPEIIEPVAVDPVIDQEQRSAELMSAMSQLKWAIGNAGGTKYWDKAGIIFSMGYTEDKGRYFNLMDVKKNVLTKVSDDPSETPEQVAQRVDAEASSQAQQIQNKPQVQDEQENQQAEVETEAETAGEEGIRADLTGASLDEIIAARELEIKKAHDEYDIAYKELQKELAAIDSKVTVVRNKGAKRDAINERATDLRLDNENKVKEILNYYEPFVKNHPETINATAVRALENVVSGAFDKLDLTELLDKIDKFATILIDAGLGEANDALIGAAAEHWAMLDEQQNKLDSVKLVPTDVITPDIALDKATLYGKNFETVYYWTQGSDVWGTTNKHKAEKMARGGKIEQIGMNEFDGKLLGDKYLDSVIALYDSLDAVLDSVE